jgi:hypothetical protein
MIFFMARQMGPFFFVGAYNGMVGYKVGDKYFFRSIPDHVTQTTATKKAAEDFSAASSCSKLVRQALHQSMDLKQEHQLTNRLNKPPLPVMKVKPNNKPSLKKIPSYKEHYNGTRAILQQRE